MVRPGKVNSPASAETPAVEVADVTKPTCKHLEGCARPARKLGWCSMHYNRLRTTGDVGPARKLTRWGEAAAVCSVDGCADPARAKDLCDVHYQRMRTNGDTGSPNLLRRRLPKEVRSWTAGQRHRFYKYGLTPEAFDRMLAGQDGRCFICGTKEPNGKGWSVDHCHTSGKVRFILCNPCNAALGLIKEDPVIARRLYEVTVQIREV